MPRQAGVANRCYFPGSVLGDGGAVPVAAGSVVVVGAGEAAFTGILSFCPTLMLSVFMALAVRSALMLTPNCVAIFVRLSPDFTV